jgi:hypothetical protein
VLEIQFPDILSYQKIPSAAWPPERIAELSFIPTAYTFDFPPEETFSSSVKVDA